jgi:hypothetical protein
LQIGSAVDVTPAHGQSERADVWLHFGIVLIIERTAVSRAAESAMAAIMERAMRKSTTDILRRGQNLQRNCLSKDLELLR